MLRWYKDVCDIFNENNTAYCSWGYKGDFPIVDENYSPRNRSLLQDYNRPLIHSWLSPKTGNHISFLQGRMAIRPCTDRSFE